MSTSLLAPSSKAIADVLRPYVEEKTFSGIVTAVANREKFLAVNAVGLADLSTQQPMQQDTMFWIASTSKPVTGAALMMLWDEGKFDLDDPVEKFLPIFKGQMLEAYTDENVTVLKKPARPFTVREILCHCAGLPFRTRVEFPMDTRLISEQVMSYAMAPLVAEPGTKYGYSNAGTNTAGRLIEVFSGMSYWEFLKTRLLEPLSMKQTSFLLSDAQFSRLAKGYRVDSESKSLIESPLEQMSLPLSRQDRFPFPAGGLFSDVHDVTRFGQMILGGGTCNGKRLLSPQAIRQMTSTQTGKLFEGPQGPGSGYGLCLATTSVDPGTPCTVDNAMAGPAGHGGAWQNRLWIDSQKGLVYTLLIQCTGDGGGGKVVKLIKEFEQAAADTLA